MDYKTEKTRFFKAFLEAVPSPAFYKDSGGVYRECNSIFAEQIFGLSIDKVIGHTLFDFVEKIPRQLAEKYYKADIDLLTNPGKQEYTSEVLCSDGKKRIFSFSKTTYPDGADQPEGIIGIMTDITEKSNIHHALLDTEEKYRLLFDNMINGFAFHEIIMDGDVPVDYSFIEVNHAFENITGLKSGDITGKRVTEIFSGIEHSEEDWINTYSKVALTGKPVRFESYFQNLDKWFSISAYSPGRGLFATIFEDISKRKLTEENLRISEEMFSKAFNASPAIMLITTLTDGKLVDANESFTQTTGYAREETIGKTVFDLGLYSSPEERVNFVEKLNINGFVRNFPLSFITKDMEKRSGLVSSDIIKIMGVDHRISVVDDITDLKRIEDKLRSFSFMVEQSSDSMIMYDIQGRIKYVNRETERLYGYRQAELIGKQFNIFVPEGEAPEIVKSIVKSLRHDRPYLGENYNRRKDGTNFFCRYRIFALYDEEGSLYGYAGIQTDISQQKRTEEELRVAKEDAEKANLIKTEFLANMSHEIRTPMNAVIGFSDLLYSIVKNPREKEYVEAIKSAGRTLLDLISDILDLSRIEAGRMEIQNEFIDVRVILPEIVNIFEMRAAKKHLKFILDIDDAVPELVFMDEMRLRQILLNLVGNAVKFTETGYIKISSGILKSDKTEGEVDFFISVEDTGIGIPRDQFNVIFQSFKQQEGQSSRKYGGTGLGLAISKRLVEIMNGRIEVESQPGMGSRFIINFHNVKAEYTKSCAFEPEEFFRPDSVIFERQKVLVVDDVPSNRIVVREWLSRSGLEVIEAENGYEAILFAQEHQPSIILMDIRMPVMDGFEAAEMLRKDEALKSIPLIALTASVQGDDEKFQDGKLFDSFLIKPVNISDLFVELMKSMNYTLKSSDETGVGVEVSERWFPADKFLCTELLKELEFNLRKDWHEITGVILVDEVEIFASKLKEIGKRFEAEGLVEYAEKLHEHVRMFDIKKIEYELKEFPLLIELLRKKCGELNCNGR